MNEKEQDYVVKTFQRNRMYNEFLTFLCFTNKIDEWSFLFFQDGKGVKIPNDIFFQQGGLLTTGINGHGHLNFLDKIQASELQKKRISNFEYVNCINLDTNVVSYMDNLFFTRNKNVNKNLYLFLRKLLENKKLDFTCAPYMIENCTKLDTPSILQGVKRSLNAFFTYKAFNNIEDFDAYFCGESMYNYPNEIIKEAEDCIAGMFNLKHGIDKKEIFLEQKAIHALFLQTIIINFASNKGIKFKASQLLDCFVNELGRFFEREMAICYFYLKKDERTKEFFRKIQKNSSDILNVIEGMSWDMYHIRQLENSMTMSEYSNVSFELHSLATYDNGLKDMLAIYPIESISFNKVRKRKNVMFIEDFNDLVEEVDFSIYWSKRSPERRNVIFEKTDWNYAIRIKEQELLDLLKDK